MFADLDLDWGAPRALPRMAPVRQTFERRELEDPARHVAEQIGALSPKAAGRVAVGVGSRGIPGIASIVAAVVEQLKHAGAEPFVFPAMGTHGAATAEGQIEVLAALGVDEASVGAPVRATMDTKVVGQVRGLDVHVGAEALDADGIVLVNRIKPHTHFHGRVESGLVKMLAVGTGKRMSASTLHGNVPADAFCGVLEEVAKTIVAATPFLFGVALVEDAYGNIADAEVLAGERMFVREPELLQVARSMMGRLLFERLDVLVIEEMGKDISGAGFDALVADRKQGAVRGALAPIVERIVVTRLTEASHGNAIGVGLVDVVTHALFEAIDWKTTYTNVVGSTVIEAGRLPMVAPSERIAVDLALRSLVGLAPADARIVRIKNTLELDTVLASEALLSEVDAHPRMERAGTLCEGVFGGA